ncbi:hypothetical protein H6G41_34185 [Tolypothrix sp. FACHB-123]|uniref:hypothetical protein n=1 Tax=Tolypothrix sp. FACHB-123 TaxID=2692868 RepID=UPI001687789E|nr:hypothetical protein [Tolypothrix sp. FACHB-123]MBD2359535.1 hypothetical protein [Tolypothrix sp. FACHB-123]
MGYEPLRQAIAFYLARSRAVQAQDYQQMQENAIALHGCIQVGWRNQCRGFWNRWGS